MKAKLDPAKIVYHLIEMIGKTGKINKFTAKVVNGKFIELIKHYKTKDKKLSYDYGKRIYDNRDKFYLSETRGHFEEVPKTVSRYEREPPVFRKPKLIEKHRRQSLETKKRRMIREAILKQIQYIRKCTYRLAQYIFKTVLKPLGINVENNPAVPLDPIHLVVQYSNSTLYIVWEAPDYWLGDEQVTTGYLKVDARYYTYKDVILEDCGWYELQQYMDSLHIQSLEGATIIGLAGMNES